VFSVDPAAALVRAAAQGVGGEEGMNGISTDALVGLAGVALGFAGSLIVMLADRWLEEHRIRHQRRYERVRDRIDRLEPHIVRLNRAASKEPRSLLRGFGPTPTALVDQLGLFDS